MLNLGQTRTQPQQVQNILQGNGDDIPQEWRRLPTECQVWWQMTLCHMDPSNESTYEQPETAFACWTPHLELQSHAPSLLPTIVKSKEVNTGWLNGEQKEGWTKKGRHKNCRKLLMEKKSIVQTDQFLCPWMQAKTTPNYKQRLWPTCNESCHPA